MASMEPLPDDLSNATEPEEETTALQRKRTRRVSFADITSVHVFDRDEDFDTPPDPKPGLLVADGGMPVDSTGDSADTGDSDDSKDWSRRDDREEDGDEEEDEQELFVRNLELSSPGSAAGSATSNEEDFFGPVSTSFIRTGRLSSESAVSHDDPDVTLDSTAFSLHYRSLAHSEDSFSNLSSQLKSPGITRRSPYGKPLSGGSILESPRSSMVLTGIKKSSLLDVSDGISTGGKSSNDMSLIVDNPNRYNYGNLSPRVSELLAKSRADLNLKSPLNQSSPTPSNYASSGKKLFPINERARSISPNRDDDRVVAAGGLSSGTLLLNDVSHGLGLHSPDKKGKFLASDTVEQQSELSSRNDDEARWQRLDFHYTGDDAGILPECVASTPTVKLTTTFQASSVPAKESGAMEADVQHLKHTLSASSLRTKRRKLFQEMTNSDKAESLLNSWTAKKFSFSRNEKGLYSKERNSLINRQFSINNNIGKSASPGLASTFVYGNDSDEILESKTLQLTPAKNLSAVEEPSLTSAVQSSLVFGVSPFARQKQNTGTPIMVGSFLADNLDGSGGLLGAPFRIANSLSSPNLLDSHLYDTVDKRAGAVASIPSDTHSKSSVSLSSMIKGNLDCSPIFMKGLQDDLGTNSRGDSLSAKQSDVFQLTSWSKVEVDPTEFGEQATENDGDLTVSLKHSSPVCYRQEPSILLGKIQQMIVETERSPSKQVNPKANENKLLPKHDAKSFSAVQFEEGGKNEIEELRHSLSTHDGVTFARIPVLGRNYVEEKERSAKNENAASEVIDRVLHSFSEESNFYKSSGNQQSITSKTIVSNWKDACSISFETNIESLSTSITKLNLDQFNKLENILVLFEKVKKNEKLLEEIQFKPTSNCRSKIKFERAIKARSLLHKLMCEKAKSFILKTKRDSLTKNAEQLKKEREVFQSLKAILVEHRQQHAAIENQIVEGSVPVSSDLNAKMKVEHLGILSMREESLVLEQNLRNLLELFPSSWGIKDGSFTEEIVLHIADHVQKEIHSRNIRRYLQSWELCDVKKKNGRLNIVLSYGGFLFQRFIIPLAPASQIISSCMLNAVDILKRFPNTNALVAFEFIFHHKSEHMFPHWSGIKHDIQVSNFLLANLLDVLNEIRRAQIDLPNLIDSTFHSSKDDQLNLQLHFIDFKTGNKVNFILDMSDVKCGVYPSEILPSQLQIQFLGMDASSSSEIVNVVGTLDSGPSMIFRFCKHISQLVETCSGWL